MTVWIAFGVAGLVVPGLAAAVVADALADRRGRVPERLAVHIPGQYPAYVRHDRARALRGDL